MREREEVREKWELYVQETKVGNEDGEKSKIEIIRLLNKLGKFVALFRNVEPSIRLQTQAEISNYGVFVEVTSNTRLMQHDTQKLTFSICCTI